MKDIFTMTNIDITNLLSSCSKLKPADLIIDDLQWKYLVRSVYRGKNILLVGATRSGKTKAAISVAKALGREDKFYKFNFGSTQDARATIIGNTTFKKEEGTVFNPSQFVSAIQTPGAIILLDELSRGHHDAWNIIMPVLDTTQRYLRLDEREDSAVIPVAEGVTFIATANIGNEYTATRVMDKALTARFPTIIEMKTLNKDEEFELLTVIHPTATKEQRESFYTLCRIANDTKEQSRMEDAKIDSFIPTGTVVEMAEMVLDGFSLKEIVATSVYPLYGEEGGADSQRLYVKQMVQKYLGKDPDPNSPINDPAKPAGKVRINF
jgi:midasin (ATPase involved in ribosome maturation)